MSGTTAAAKVQDWSYLFSWKCRVCAGTNHSCHDCCQTVNCGAARWWAGVR